MRFALILFSLSLYFQTLGQSSVERILSLPITNREMSEVLAREAFLESNQFNSPWIRELDFRVRSNDREIGLEDYRLRFGLINPFEVAANKDYRRMMLSQQGFERKKQINNILLRRYELLLESYFLTSSISMNQSFLIKLDEIKAMVIAEQFDMSDVVDIELEKTKIEVQLAELKLKREVIDQTFQSYGIDQLPDWGSFSLIQSAQIQSILGHQIDDSLSVKLLSEQLKLKQEESIMQIKKAEAFSNIGFIQAEYDTERGKALDDHLGFQLGFTIPVFNQKKPDLQRRQLELIEDQSSLEGLASAEKETKSLEYIRVDGLIEQEKSIKEKRTALTELKKLAYENGADIKVYKKILEYELYLSQKELGYRSDISMKFIKMLHDYGRLADEPYLNYLSASLNTFSLSLE